MSFFSRMKQGFDARHRRMAASALRTESDLAAQGLLLGQLTAVAALPAEQFRRMTTMAEVFGIDLSGAPALRADLALTCAGCLAQGDCRAALNLPDPPRRTDIGFCPNAARLGALAAQQG